MIIMEQVVFVVEIEGVVWVIVGVSVVYCFVFVILYLL